MNTSRPVSPSRRWRTSTAGSQVVIITSGIARKPGQTRLDLGKVNVGIIKSIAKEIVLRHGGTISAVEPENGQGTTIRIVLPIRHASNVEARYE